MKIRETESGMKVARGWGRSNGESVFNGCRVSIWEDEKVMEIIVVIAVQQCECT